MENQWSGKSEKNEVGWQSDAFSPFPLEIDTSEG